MSVFFPLGGKGARAVVPVASLLCFQPFGNSVLDRLVDTGGEQAFKHL